MTSSFLFFVFCFLRWRNFPLVAQNCTSAYEKKNVGRMKVSLKAVVVDNADYLKEVELVEKL